MKNRQKKIYKEISDWTSEAMINCILVVINLSVSITFLAIPALIWTLELIPIWQYYKNSNVSYKDYEIARISLCVLILMSLMSGLTANTIKTIARVLIVIGITVTVVGIEFVNGGAYKFTRYIIATILMLIFGPYLIYVGIKIIKSERKKEW